MKKQKQFIPIEEVIANKRGHKLADAKLETLNRARLDALGYMLQASHWLDELVESARKLDRSLTEAERLLRKRERALEKADRAFWAYAEKEAK
jgi:hypothetical protein